MFTYGHGVLGVLLGLGLLFNKLKKRMDDNETSILDLQHMNPANVHEYPYRYQIFKHNPFRRSQRTQPNTEEDAGGDGGRRTAETRDVDQTTPWWLYIVCIVFVATNAFIVAVPFVPNKKPNGDPPTIPSKYLGAVILPMYLLGAIVGWIIPQYCTSMIFFNSQQRTDGTWKFASPRQRRWKISFAEVYLRDKVFGPYSLSLFGLKLPSMNFKLFKLKWDWESGLRYDGSYKVKPDGVAEMVDGKLSAEHFSANKIKELCEQEDGRPNETVPMGISPLARHGATSPQHNRDSYSDHTTGWRPASFNASSGGFESGATPVEHIPMQQQTGFAGHYNPVQQGGYSTPPSPMQQRAGPPPSVASSSRRTSTLAATTYQSPQLPPTIQEHPPEDYARPQL